jgi:phosphoglycolate phosphatase-like HAD superfamily hydrolase
MLKCIETILLEPVGCLAEFSPEPFHEIATRFLGFKGDPVESGSAAYWHLLTLLNSRPLLTAAEALETQAVSTANIFEDVRPALAELKALGVRLSIASSLSGAAISRFLERHGLGDFFAGVSSRDDAGGTLAAPLLHALRATSLVAESTIYLTDSVEGIRTAKSAGVHPILMMNDPDEARRLATHNPTGGIVSLHELPDFIRLIEAQNGPKARGR